MNCNATAIRDRFCLDTADVDIEGVLGAAMHEWNVTLHAVVTNADLDTLTLGGSACHLSVNAAEMRSNGTVFCAFCDLTYKFGDGAAVEAAVCPEWAGELLGADADEPWLFPAEREALRAAAGVLAGAA